VSTSLVVRILRPVTLLAAGMLLGQAALSVTSPTTAATMQSRTSSCAGFAFQPLDSDTYSGYLPEGVRYGAPQRGSGIFVCDPKLPNRAVVTSIRFVLWDESPEGEIEGCGLYRTGTTESGAPRVVAMGRAPSTGLAARPHRVTVSDRTITSATVNMASWGYWLQCQVHFPTAEGRFFEAGIVSAHVNYKVDPTKA
jgi:hypothetical protein